VTKEQDHCLILDFWFGNSADDVQIFEQKSSLWWRKDEELDREIESAFSAALKRLIAGQLTFWKQDAESLLAMIILADQFSRNIYRNKAKAFAQDDLALALSLEGLESRIDLKLGIAQRIFFYMPLEHSESMSMQDRSVEMFEQLCESAPENVRQEIIENLDYAIKHREVIEKFGRFPHRNAILGRESRPEEIEYLKQPGSGF
jgi:uncharacterized protein (DUF924 family)